MTRAVCPYLAVAFAVAAQVSSAMGLPSWTTSLTYASGQNVTGVGPINSPFMSPGAGAGYFGVSINNSSAGYVLLGINQAPRAAVVNTTTGLTAFLASGAEVGEEDPDPGYTNVPSTDYTYDTGYSVSTNTAGNGLISLRLRPIEFPMEPVSPITGVYFNKTAMPIKEGDMVTAAGVAPGTVFAAFSAAGSVMLNDNGVAMIAGSIIESAQTRKAIIKVALDGSGNVISQQLVAKEGGPVGAGPSTWTTLFTSAGTCAINNAGQVIFSGITSTGVDGIYLSSPAQFLAISGGPTPIPGTTWRPLAGTPVDISNIGQFAFRGIVEGNGIWNESGDAGETFSSSFTFTANSTIGGGYLREIAGSLSTDHDVDLYYIAVGDATLQTQEPFTVTTVPNPGMGFAGAAFDTVLYLFRPDFNANGNVRAGYGRNDNVSAGVVQSSLSAASLPTTHTPGTKYFLGISTPKARAYGGFSADVPSDVWLADPNSLAVADGMILWVDPSLGQMGRATASTGALLTPLQIATVPPQTSEGQPAGADAPFVAPMIAAYDAGASSKVYHYYRGWGLAQIRRSNLDGSAFETILFGGPAPGSASSTTAMAVESTVGTFYWAQNGPGNSYINKSDLAGGGITNIIVSGGFRPINAIAIDPGVPLDKVYWNDTVLNEIRRADADGSNVQTVATGLNVVSLAVNAAGRRLYYTSATGNRVGAIHLDTLAVQADLAATTWPSGLTYQPSDGRAYWSNPLERLVRRTLVSAPATQDWTAIGADTGESPADGPAYLSPFKLFQKFGTPVNTPLPYRIKMTGATYANPTSMICRNNKFKVALAGEALPASLGQPVTTVGNLGGTVKISDRGLVAWRGRWLTAGGSTRTALFLNQTALFDDTTIPMGGAAALGSLESGINLDMSPSGQYILARATNGSFNGSSDNAATVGFSAVPGCKSDFNGSGTVTVQDLFDFLAAWFAGSPAADFNGSGTVTVQDLFDFLAAWFAPCTS